MPMYRGSRRLVMLRKGSSYDPSAQAWFNAVVAAGGTVSDTQKGFVNTLITSLKTHSLWTIQDRIWLHASENAQQATIDIVNLGVATLVNAPTFTASQGYAGNGTSSYLDSSYSPTVNGVNFTRNDASVSSYCRTSRTSGAGGSNIGLHDAASSGNMTALFTYSTGVVNYDVSNAQFSAQVANANAQGMYTAVRTGASAQAVYKSSNSTALGTNTTSSIALANLNFFILARNQNATPVNFLSDQVAITTIGGSMTNGTNVAQFQTDLNAYMTSLGTNVY